VSRNLNGRLVFNQAGRPRPLHGATLRATLHHTLWSDTDLGDITTDAEGRFQLALDEDSECTLRLVIIEHRQVYTHAGTSAAERPSTQIKLDLSAEQTELGDVAIGYWPYRTDFPSPRAGTVDGKPCQVYTTGYKHTLIRAFAGVLPSQAMLHAEHALAKHHPTMDQIQKHQPKTRTLRADAETPGISRSDAWLGEQLLNGFDIELLVGKNAEDESQLRARIQWPEMTAKGIFDLTCVDVIMEPRETEVVPVQITLRVRQPADDGTWLSDTTRTFSPTDGADWEAAKRAVRCQYLLHGAMDGHIIRSHFQTEMYAVAAFRNLRQNPVAHVLKPHLLEIVAQDHDGDSFAWGPGGLIPEQSGLTMAHILQRTGNKTGGWDWKTFSPRTSAHSTHRYAQAGALYWGVLTEYLEAYFAEHQASIIEQWHEVLGLSNDLVEHSPPYCPQSDDPLVIPFDRNELDDPQLPRATIDGVTRAVRPVTQTSSPAAGELDDLLQLCRYVIYQSTFNHSWTHDGQYDAGGELRYATFGLRGGSIGAEDDPDIAPLPPANIDGISTNTIGLHANYGYILADEEQDVPPGLKAALQAKADDFAALSLDVKTIRSRINI
jgi:hypothetical protein